MAALDQLNAAPTDAFVDELGGIYEHSPWVAEAVVSLRPFDSPAALGRAMREAVDAAPPERRMELIRAHPDLAGKLARAGALSGDSTREQAGLGLDRLSDDEYERFSSLNAAYRERFGFPFIICARKHRRADVIAAFERRLGHDRGDEVDEAMRQIHDIAALRLADRLDDRANDRPAGSSHANC